MHWLQRQKPISFQKNCFFPPDFWEKKRYVEKDQGFMCCTQGITAFQFSYEMSHYKQCTTFEISEKNRPTKVIFWRLLSWYTWFLSKNVHQKEPWIFCIVITASKRFFLTSQKAVEWKAPLKSFFFFFFFSL